MTPNERRLQTLETIIGRLEDENRRLCQENRIWRRLVVMVQRNGAAFYRALGAALQSDRPEQVLQALQEGEGAEEELDELEEIAEAVSPKSPLDDKTNPVPCVRCGMNARHFTVDCEWVCDECR